MIYSEELCRRHRRCNRDVRPLDCRIVCDTRFRGSFLLARWTGEGSYGGRTVISSGSVLLAALIGFVAGLGWTFRRSRKLVAQR